tara:strand:- start:1132 stop:2535 length:1404 start_codon:yes stop_codon:yes gene_type:complete
MNEIIDRNNPNQLCIPILSEEGAYNLGTKSEPKELAIIFTVMIREIIAHLGKHGENIDLEYKKVLENDLISLVKQGADLDAVSEELIRFGSEFYDDDYLNQYSSSFAYKEYLKAADNEKFVYETEYETEVEAETSKRYTLAYERFEQKQYEVSIELFNNVIEINPNHLSSFLCRGLANMHTSKYEAAENDFSKVIELDNNNFEGYYHRGYVRGFFLDNFLGALLDYDKAIDNDENHIQSRYERAELYQKNHNYPHAIKDYDELVSIDTDNLDKVFYRRGICNFEFTDYDKSISDYTKSLEISLDPNVLLARAKSYSKVKNYQSALEDFNKSIDIEPSVESYYERGLFWIEFSKNKENKEFLRNAINDLNIVKESDSSIQINGVTINDFIASLLREINFNELNFYEILEVDKSATSEEITKRWKILLKKWHPDVNKHPNSKEMTKKINQAYQTLIDPVKRKKYDEQNF